MNTDKIRSKMAEQFLPVTLSIFFLGLAIGVVFAGLNLGFESPIENEAGNQSTTPTPSMEGTGLNTTDNNTVNDSYTTSNETDVNQSIQSNSTGSE